MTTNESTGSRKIDRIVNEARALGLRVSVAWEDSEWIDGLTSRRVSIEVRRQTVVERNMLDVFNNSEVIVVGWSWIRTSGATPKMHFARKYGYLMEGTDITAKILPHMIRGMAD